WRDSKIGGRKLACPYFITLKMPEPKAPVRFAHTPFQELLPSRSVPRTRTSRSVPRHTCPLGIECLFGTGYAYRSLHEEQRRPSCRLRCLSIRRRTLRDG